MSTHYKSPEELLGRYSNLAEEIAALEDAWGLKPRPRRSAAMAASIKAALEKRKKPEPRPTLSPAWTPCRHWGGIRECECCGSKTQAANMREAQALFEQYERYVTGLLLKKFKLQFVNKKEHPHFADVELLVWTTVASKIDGYVFESKPAEMKWLSTLTDTVWMDYWRGCYKKKRDIRLTVSLSENMDHGIPDPRETGGPAKPTPTATNKNKFKEPEDTARLRQDMLVYKFRHRDRA